MGGWSCLCSDVVNVNVNETVIIFWVKFRNLLSFSCGVKCQLMVAAIFNGQGKIVGHDRKRFRCFQYVIRKRNQKVIPRSSHTYEFSSFPVFTSGMFFFFVQESSFFLHISFLLHSCKALVDRARILKVSCLDSDESRTKMVSGFFFTRKRFIIALTCILGLPFTLFILQRDEGSFYEH